MARKVVTETIMVPLDKHEREKAIGQLLKKRLPYRPGRDRPGRPETGPALEALPHPYEEQPHPSAH